MAEWDRLEGEPSLWFDRFERFRRDGPGRSVDGTYRAETGRKGTAGRWHEEARKWRWKERAEAWDALQVRLAREAEGAALQKRREAWAAQAQAVQSKAIERLLKLPAEDLKPRDVLAFFTEGVKLELLARGQATEKHEYSIGDIDRAIERQLERLAGGGQDPPPGEAEAGPGGRPPG